MLGTSLNNPLTIIKPERQGDGPLKGKVSLILQL